MAAPTFPGHHCVRPPLPLNCPVLQDRDAEFLNRPTALAYLTPLRSGHAISPLCLRPRVDCGCECKSPTVSYTVRPTPLHISLFHCQFFERTTALLSTALAYLTPLRSGHAISPLCLRPRVDCGCECKSPTVSYTVRPTPLHISLFHCQFFERTTALLYPLPLRSAIFGSQGSTSRSFSHTPIPQTPPTISSALRIARATTYFRSFACHRLQNIHRIHIEPPQLHSAPSP